MEEFAIFLSISFVVAVFATIKILELDIPLRGKLLVGFLISAAFTSVVIILLKQLFLELYYVNILCLPLAISV